MKRLEQWLATGRQVRYCRISVIQKNWFHVEVESEGLADQIPSLYGEAAARTLEEAVNIALDAAGEVAL